MVQSWSAYDFEPWKRPTRLQLFALIEWAMPQTAMPELGRPPALAGSIFFRGALARDQPEGRG